MMLLLCAFVAGSSSVWGVDQEVYKAQSNVTFTGGDHFTVVADINSGTAPAYNSSEQGVRLYCGSYLSITPKNGETISAVTLSVKCNKGGKKNVYPTGVSSNVGTITAGATPGDNITSITWEGTVTDVLTFTVAGSAGNVSVKTVTITYTYDTREDAELSWSSSSATVTYGADDNIFPTLTNPHNVSVTYASTNEDAATIDANTGEITLKDVSANLTTYITATFDGNDDYKNQTVGYTLTVNKAPFAIKDGVFDFVKAGKADPVVDYGSNVSPTTDANHYESSDATWTAGNVTMVTSGKYRWWDNDKSLRFYSNNPQSKLTLSVPDEFVITKVEFTGGSNFSPNVGTLTSRTWTGAANSIVFTYNKTSGSINVNTITVTYRSATATFTISCEGGYASYSCDIPLDFSNSGAEAYIIKSSTENSASLTKVTKVPANTGIIVKGTKDEEVNVPMATGDMDDVEGNLLHGTVNTPKDVAQDEAYGLSKADGLFHLMNAGTIPANKAYLLASEVFQGTASPVLVLDFDSEATAIDDVRSKTEDVRGDFYNLNGQRVAQPTKGLYIVNGKKYIVK